MVNQSIYFLVLSKPLTGTFLNLQLYGRFQNYTLHSEESLQRFKRCD